MAATGCMYAAKGTLDRLCEAGLIWAEINEAGFKKDGPNTMPISLQESRAMTRRDVYFQGRTSSRSGTRFYCSLVKEAGSLFQVVREQGLLT